MGLEKITTLAMLAIFIKVTLANVIKLSGNAIFPAYLSFSAIICLQIITCKTSGDGIFFVCVMLFGSRLEPRKQEWVGKRLKLIMLDNTGEICS